MHILLNTPEANSEEIIFPKTPAKTIKHKIVGKKQYNFMAERMLHNGFSVYYTEFSSTSPVRMSSDSWPTGFSWVFFLSGQALYDHKSIGQKIEMRGGMNRNRLA